MVNHRPSKDNAIKSVLQDCASTIENSNANVMFTVIDILKYLSSIPGCFFRQKQEDNQKQVI